MAKAVAEIKCTHCEDRLSLTGTDNVGWWLTMYNPALKTGTPIRVTREDLEKFILDAQAALKESK